VFLFLTVLCMFKCCLPS